MCAAVSPCAYGGDGVVVGDVVGDVVGEGLLDDGLGLACGET